MQGLFGLGYIKIARQICHSEIWLRPAHFLKLWLWLLVSANWRNFGDIQRGELVVNQRDLDFATRSRGQFVSTPDHWANPKRPQLDG